MEKQFLLKASLNIRPYLIIEANTDNIYQVLKEVITDKITEN